MSLTAFKILHVEDDPLYAALVRAMLDDRQGRERYELVQTDSLKQALRHVRRKDFSAVLLDLSLDDVSGVDNVRAVAEENPDLPIIVVSGVDNAEIALKALDEGAQDVLVKGEVDPKYLRQAIRHAVRRKAQERALFRQANRDAMTGLANRQAFLQQLARRMDRARGYGQREWMILIGVSAVRSVNATLGFEAGDAVLCETAKRLAAILPPEMLARAGGNVFAALLGEEDETENAQHELVASLEAVLELPIVWQGHRIACPVRIKPVRFPDAQQDAGIVLRGAVRGLCGTETLPAGPILTSPGDAMLSASGF